MIGYCFHNTIYVSFPENLKLATAYYVHVFHFNKRFANQKNLTAFPRLDTGKRPQLEILFFYFPLYRATAPSSY